MKIVKSIQAAILVAVGYMLPLSAQAEGEALSGMISPVSNPVLFEDPRIQTSIRPIFMYHKIPSDFITGSGDVQLWALQARVALTDRLAFIATKDGYVQINADAGIDDAEGAANLAGGLQYAIHKDTEQGSILTLGLRYEAPTGDPDVFQGNGDGSINPHVSAGLALDSLNLLGYSDLRLAIDDRDSSFWDVSLHADVPLGPLYPLAELNLVHVMNSGSRIGLGGEGFDVVNFGSSGSDGSTVVTAAVGFRVRATDWLDIGTAYEFALTDREDMFDWRLTADMIFSCPWVVFE